ncbi:flagellar basal body-associated FliL family protein [Brevundimonas goettingensis]|jgi:flagellar FliL protein|uniref:Flagellar protein FliL n=1 Tax=Brevundimonas goettingensis TaxID=2774190 RepID=A0A975GWR6_9CAUL|nr:flagellar basal body-associated FliL family protein [Brevundimonas goettingensis]QTC89770.1 flagellar basal body-associated FliL family protein [Brevundimonas goettingensis]
MLKLGKKKGPPEDTATDIAVAHGHEVDGDAPAKKKLPLLFIIAPVAALVLIGGGAGAFFMLQPKPDAAAEGEHGEAAGGHGEEKAEGHGKKEEKKGGHGAAKEGEGEAAADPSLGVIAEGPDGVTFLTLPDMVVDIQSQDGRPTHMQLKLTLEMKDADLATTLQEQMPRMQDMFQGFLRELRPEDMAGSAGSYQLRAEILRRVNLIAAPGKVDAVLIEKMLIQ